MKKRALLFTVTAFLVLTAPSFGGYVDHFTRTDDIGQYKAPNRGVSHILVIRVQVNDKPYDWAPWEAFFDNDAPGFTFRNYYREQSLGRYDPIVTLTDPIEYDTCPAQFNNPKLFPNCSIARGDPNALLPGLSLIHEIFERLTVEQPWINLADFDINGINGAPDGWLDGVILISNLDFTGIALPTSIFYDVEITWGLCAKMIEGLAPYLGGLNIDPDEVCPLLVNMTPEELQNTPPFDQLYLLEAQGKKVGMVGIASSLDPLIIPIHEFGHVLGFGDLYREHYATDPPYTKTIPGLKYSMMGSYGNNYVPQFDAFSRMRIGWANPIPVQGTMTVLIPPVLESGVVYYFETGNEMFVVENRGPESYYDSIFSKNGLAVYHVNLLREPDPGPFGFVFMLLNCLNCDDWKPFIMNEQADGLFELQRGITGTNPDNDLFHTGDEFPTGMNYEPPPSPTNLVLNSNNYNGRYTGFSITDIDSDTYAPYILATLSDNVWTVPVTKTETVVKDEGWGCRVNTASSNIIDLILTALMLVAGTYLIKRTIKKQIEER